MRLGVTDERLHSSSELFADGPAYQVIGVARDTRGVEFDGSDSKQIYLPLREDRLPSHPYSSEPSPARHRSFEQSTR